jgi:hypothetical protein
MTKIIMNFNRYVLNLDAVRFHMLLLNKSGKDSVLADKFRDFHR